MSDADDADEAKQASGAKANKSDAQSQKANDESLARPEELLIHPDDHPEPGQRDPFGSPGAPISRHSPFYMGFFGGLGLLLALLIGFAVREAQSALVLVLVSFFLAVGLNPIVELLMHRGIRRRWSVFLVSLGVLSIMTLFVVALVPVLRDQITALIDSAPGWLDDLSRNRTVRDLDAKYEILSKIKEKLQDPELAQQAFGSIFTVGLAVLNAFINAFLIFVLTLYFSRPCPSSSGLATRWRRRHAGSASRRWATRSCAGSEATLPERS